MINNNINVGLRLTHCTRIVLSAISLFLACCFPANATNYYVDPATGNMNNPGTSALPWSTLEAVFAAYPNNKFVAGDVIYLRSGYHGKPIVSGTITNGTAFIQPDTGASPALYSLTCTNASNWTISGLDICSENLAPGTYNKGYAVAIGFPSSYITIQNCTIEGAKSIAGWAATDWYNNLGNQNYGIGSSGPHTTLLNNVISNIAWGLSINGNGNPDGWGAYTLVSGNTVQNFYMDGMHCNADDCVLEYNVVKNSYISDSNHDDLFQSWSTGTDGKTVGSGTVSRVTLNGNYFIEQTDPNQPLPTVSVGIGCYDGMYLGWVVENNVIATPANYGIEFQGAINCTIANNVVVDNPGIVPSTIPPAIYLAQHRTTGTNNTPWPVLSTGNTVRNNISIGGVVMSSTIGAQDHNLTPLSYNPYFTNYTGFDFSLPLGSPAIGTGTSDDAPATDIDGVTRTNPYDVGAFKYKGDLALSGSVTASSSVENFGWYKVKVVDGIEGSGTASMGWSSNNTLNSNHTEWVQVDLGSSYMIGKVILFPRNDNPYVGYYFPIDFTIAVSTDGTNWTTVVTQAGYPMPGAGQPFTFTPVNARYVKVTGTNLRYQLSLYRMQFAEIEVYQTPQPLPATTPFATGQTLGTLRNNFTGWLGMEITTGTVPMTVTDLGRMVASGNTGSHTLELVQYSGFGNVILGSVTVNTLGAPAGAFLYSSLSQPVTLRPHSIYFIVSQETTGGDYFYDDDTVLTPTTATDAVINQATWSTDNSRFYYHQTTNHSYVPVSFHFY